MKQCTILGLLLLSLTHAFSQAEAERVRVAFYNLENLFYPEDDSLKADEEFTPQGQRYWSYYRYREKSNRMAKAILSIGEWEAPDIVGVAEIENRQVLQDLVESPTLAPFHYRVGHFES
ncbi:MAG TPA: endonuclease, partial [Cryomorphaceae bacterium]|nr:endonuclease [Cryomorphaceae bacterium]